ncbi:hypothetical protein KJ965_03070 [Patescibacteria group bacterium]|nr:hypothetical protein [Patescibacteria group bacterium]
MQMHRTQIYFPEEHLEILRQEAVKKGVSLARIIRSKVEAKTPAIKTAKKRKTKKIKMTGAGLLLKMAKQAEKQGFKGPKDLASNVDKYLYGA